MKIKIAIIGYGNIGKYAIEAVEASPDMELVGLVRRSNKNNTKELQNYKVVENIDDLGKVDVALICCPTRNIEEIAINILAKGINTVDSFDIHSEIVKLRKKLNEVAKNNNVVSVISAGWDPGSDSVIRTLLKAIAPCGLTYTNFGPGMSMGHSVVAKSKTGVEDALSMTMPLGDGIHRRLVYLQMKENADFDLACKEIKADSYFINDETKFFQVKNLKEVVDTGHGTEIVRKGVSGKTQNQLFNFTMKINNPALTSQIMVASARATMKLEKGCYTMIEIPLIKLLAGNEEDLIKELV